MVNRKSSLIQDVMEGARLQATMVGYNDPSLGIRAVHNHMTTALAGHYKTDPLEARRNWPPEMAVGSFATLPA